MKRPASVAVLALAGWLHAGLLPPGVAYAHDEGPPGFECVNGPFGLPGPQGPPSVNGEWSPLMQWPERAIHSSLMHTGKVLWWSGLTLDAWVWDPATEQHTMHPAPTDLLCAGHAALADGRILTIGGTSPTTTELPDTNIFDPVAETWTEAADMWQGRWYPTATTLPDGRILAVSGRLQTQPFMFAKIPEIYDPDTDTWTQLTGAQKTLLYYPFQHVLPDGKLYVAGPDLNTWLLDWDTETWTQSASSLTEGSGGTVTMYRPWNFMKRGESDEVEVIDMSGPTPQWREVAATTFPRRDANLVNLPDGTIFLVGGSVDGKSSPECAVHQTAIWDPATEMWTPMASLQDARMYHATATLLPDGRVLAGGGENSHTAGGNQTAEIFSPPYLFKGPRPTVAAAPASVGWGQGFQVETPDAASIASVVFIRPGSNTHNFDMDDRSLPLSFTSSATQLDLTAPADGNLAPPGYYLLFLVDTNGVPSMGQFVQVGSPTPAVPSLSIPALTLLAALLMSGGYGWTRRGCPRRPLEGGDTSHEETSSG